VRLERLGGGHAFAALVPLTLSCPPGPLPMFIRFESGEEELRSLEMTLDVKAVQ
jgi:hypothetical protein